MPKSPPTPPLAPPRVDERAGLVLELAQLFALQRDHRRDDIHVFEELIGELYPRADTSERRAVAEALADHPELPPSVAAMIASDEPDVAGPILRRSTRLTTIDRVRAIGNGREEHRVALASRTDLEEATISALLIHGERATIEALAANPHLNLTPIQMDRLVDRVLQVGTGLQVLTDRKDIGPTRLIDMFFDLDRPARRRALLGFDVETAFRRIEKRGRRTPPSKPAGIESRLLDAAIGHQRPVYAALLAETLGIGKDLANRIISDPGGEPLVVALSAIGLDVADATSILVRADPSFGWSYDDIRDLARLYDVIGWRTAEAILERWAVRSPAAAQAQRQTQDAPGLQSDRRRIEQSRIDAAERRDADIRARNASGQRDL